MINCKKYMRQIKILYLRHSGSMHFNMSHINTCSPSMNDPADYHQLCSTNYYTKHTSTHTNSILCML